MKYKALICDIDGTLTINKLYSYPSKKVSKAVKKALRKIHIGFATARSLDYTQYLFEDLGMSGPSILLSGTQIMDAKSHNLLWEKSMELADYIKVIEVLKLLNTPFYVDELNKSTAFSLEFIPIKPFNVYVPTLTQENVDYLKKELAPITTVRVNQTIDWNEGKYVANISNSLASKQHAVLEVAKLLNISTDEIIGVGDGPNDYPLLMACGFKVAMGNAVDELKAIADYVAPTVDDDGVADVIEKFIL